MEAPDRRVKRRLNQEKEWWHLPAGGGDKKHDVTQEFYIGLHSEEERKQLFLHYFGGSAQDTPPPTDKEALRGPLHRLDVTLQDPYDYDSWRTPAQLDEMAGEQAAIARVSDQFSSRYTVVNHMRSEVQSATRPDLYEMRTTSDYFRHLLYERDDLIMKLVPLHFPKAQSAEAVAGHLFEIYNEIIVGYFLNELVYGYSQVLSLHFMTIVDWFPTLRGAMTPTEVANGDHFYHQTIVAEKLDAPLRQFLYEQANGPSLRAALFQLFHALETAWHTNQYTHNDLHLGNIMVKRLDAGTPLHAKDFLYRRMGHDNWWRVSRHDLSGFIVKLIDFGRNRMFTPSQQAHIDTAGGEKRHVHDRLICAPGFDLSGYGCQESNRTIDVVLPLLNLLMFPAQYWRAIGERESQAFFAMCDRQLDFAALNRTVDDFVWQSGTGQPRVNRSQVETEFARVSRRVKASNIHRCPEIFELMNQTGVFLYRRWENGAVASDVLSDAYFNAYRTRSVLPLRPLTDDEVLDAQNHSVVVSFVPHMVEAEMRQDYTVETMLVESRCAVCLAPHVTLEVAGGARLCNWACYEFSHLFGGKTVYR